MFGLDDRFVGWDPEQDEIYTSDDGVNWTLAGTIPAGVLYLEPHRRRVIARGRSASQISISTNLAEWETVFTFSEGDRVEAMAPA